MIVLPPSNAGALQVSDTPLSRGAPVTPVGAPGTVGGAGVTAFDSTDSGPAPEPLMASTVNVYVVPFWRPVTVNPVAVVPVLTGVCAFAPMYGVIR